MHRNFVSNAANKYWRLFRAILNESEFRVIECISVFEDNWMTKDSSNIATPENTFIATSCLFTLRHEELSAVENPILSESKNPFQYFGSYSTLCLN